MMAGGIPLGRIVNLGSASGTGKSTITDEILYYMLFNSPHKVGVVTLESTSGQYGIKLLSRHLSKKIELLDNDSAMELLESEETKKKEHELFNDENGNPRFYLVDNRDAGVENIQSSIENLIISCECKVIVCDPIHDIISALPIDEQENFMSWQKGMVKSHMVTFLNVCHTRKTSNGQKAGSTGADLHEEDLMGSSSLYKSAACNLMFSRNKEAENEIERNTTLMKATKIRWTGKTGIAGKYYYDNEKHTLYDLDDWASENGVDLENIESVDF
jgi:archaellum biogenesis ATPase FlaH